MNTAGRHIQMQMRISRRGFSIVECVIALPIMAIFLFMAAQLFHGCWVMVRYSDDQSTQVAQRQMIIRRLRADVQSSDNIRLVNRGLLACHTPTGIIDWQLTPRGVVKRKWQRARRGRGPRAAWRSDAVMPSAHFSLSTGHVLHLVYFVHGYRRVFTTMPIAFLLPRGHR